ncbi:VacJ family lipoprotein [Niveibacterium terrae]|uniref:MlaA family lipoprotein n=1 Tax=Niveibacterium terrae TaxID=3373598 RepID=UPI003A9469EA
MKKTSLAAGAIALVVLAANAKADERDPFESFNRSVYSFNDKLDRYALKPAAQGYVAAVPLPARVAFSNFVGNFGDVPNAMNNLLQGKFSAAASDVGRVLLNSTLGVLGFVDVASEVGLEKHNKDFGQTLGYWGLKSGPFLMLPLLGPSTVRDAAALPVDYLSSPRSYVIKSVPARNSISGVAVIDIRAGLLGTDQTFDEAALDKYSFLRNFYLQRRQSLIYDGAPPPEKKDDSDSAQSDTPSSTEPEEPKKEVH